MNRKTVISLMKEIINPMKVGEEVSRKEMVKNISTILPYNSDQSIDNTRNYLTRAGYLEWKSQGVYTKVKDIPMDLTITKLMSEAYPKEN